ncbi:class I SAM-dependent methyltransferase [Nostoc sp. NIES-2111]
MPAYSLLLPVLRKLPPHWKTTLKRMAGYRRRKEIATSYTAPLVRRAHEWAWQDKEVANFYYRITPLNRDHLVQVISTVTGASYDVIDGYMKELESDEALRRHIQDFLVRSKYGDDIVVEYGRRLGWYAFVRVMKPAVIIETGVDHGVGACVIASALLRNKQEGHNGRYYGTEIRTEAGRLFAGQYREVGEILYGDSITSLEAFHQPIDIFINDSDHSADYEYREYLTVRQKLSAGAYILGDNSHVTDSLSRFSRESGRSFVFFSEKPYEHWYPGAGIGISYENRPRVSK